MNQPQRDFIPVNPPPPLDALRGDLRPLDPLMITHGTCSRPPYVIARIEGDDPLPLPPGWTDSATDDAAGVPPERWTPESLKATILADMAEEERKYREGLLSELEAVANDQSDYDDGGLAMSVTDAPGRAHSPLPPPQGVPDAYRATGHYYTPPEIVAQINEAGRVRIEPDTRGWRGLSSPWECENEPDTIEGADREAMSSAGVIALAAACAILIGALAVAVWGTVTWLHSVGKL